MLWPLVHGSPLILKTFDSFSDNFAQAMLPLRDVWLTLTTSFISGAREWVYQTDYARTTFVDQHPLPRYVLLKTVGLLEKFAQYLIFASAVKIRQVSAYNGLKVTLGTSEIKCPSLVIAHLF